MKKAFLLLLFTVCVAIGLACGGFCYYMASNYFYTMDVRSAVANGLYPRAAAKVREVRDYLNRGDLASAKACCDSGNFDVELWLKDRWNEQDGPIWTSFGGEQDGTGKEECALIKETIRFYSEELPVIGNHALSTEEDYSFYMYIDLAFPTEDNLKWPGEGLLLLYRLRYWLPGAAALCLILCAACLAGLQRSASRTGGEKKHMLLGRLPFDLLTLAVAAGSLLCIRYMGESMRHTYRSLSFLPPLMLGGTLLAVILAIYFMDVSVRVKKGEMLRQTLVYALLRGIRKGCAWLAAAVPTVIATVIAYLAVCIVELAAGSFILGNVAVARSSLSAVTLLWGAEKAVLFTAVLYVAYTCHKLLKAGRALAEGQEGYRVDTSGMFGSFREHGENLNSLGQGISRAVEERMRSERLKTELISNVSHDLKTPLTSVINYAELICEEKPENERIGEYAEVLFRQSGRLKKLLEDLIEASKATAGSLEVKLEPCEAGVLLTQAVGEYQQRMEEQGLELIVRQPEEPVAIMADGRHLWRVFDNLLNNICKYSQKGSRVFLSVEAREGRAFIIFRNMSRYILDVPPEELAERFVRGDKSRHMEGSGLGLSIARSLTELQGGRMEIVTDGDLFKVILNFGILT